MRRPWSLLLLLLVSGCATPAPAEPPAAEEPAGPLPSPIEAWRLGRCLHAEAAFTANVDDLQPLLPAGYRVREFSVGTPAGSSSAPLGLVAVTMFSCQEGQAGSPLVAFLVAVNVEPPEDVPGLAVGGQLVLLGSVTSSPDLAQDLQRWGLGPVVEEPLDPVLEHLDVVRNVGIAAGGLHLEVRTLRDDLGYATDLPTRVFAVANGTTVGAADIRPSGAGALYVGTPSMQGEAFLGSQLPESTPFVGSTVDRASVTFVYAPLGNLTAAPNEAPEPAVP